MAETITDLLIANSVSNVTSVFATKLVEEFDAAQPPRLHFELLEEDEETDLIASIRSAVRLVRDEQVVDADRLLETAASDLSEAALASARARIDQLRRNQYADTGFSGSNNDQNAYAYIAAGVVAVVAVSKAHSIISNKTDAAGFDPNGPPLGPDDGPIPVWPRNPNTPDDLPWRPGQPGWTDPLPPGFEERTFDVLEPRLRSVMLARL